MQPNFREGELVRLSDCIPGEESPLSTSSIARIWPTRTDMEKEQMGKSL